MRKTLLIIGALLALAVTGCANAVLGDSTGSENVEARATAPSGAIIVASDGTGSFKTVSAAVASLDSGTTRKVIWIKNGTYTEHVLITRKNVTLMGQSKSAVIQYNYKQSSGGWYNKIATVAVQGDGFIAQDLTFKNYAGQTAGQALAFAVLCDKAKFSNCNFYGYQDTLFVAGPGGNGNGRSYFYKCYIAGDVDYVYGPATAVFDQCTLYTYKRSSSPNGYCTAANTATSNTYKYGFVFMNCTLTGNAASGTQYLGRPWGASAYVIYKNCTMEALIAKAGWTSMSGNSVANARLYEYKSTGAGAAINSTRKQLSDSQASAITISSVLGGWNP